ncbi:hypothetical protein OL229_21290 [Neisseriaceae bacterium JH1-16]|nr:hypothetical protein [Neisseriaceae bacterium JH1-16]
MQHPDTPLNALWLLAAERAHAAIVTLTRRGFSVIGVELANPARPTLRIEPSAQCQGLLERGEAAWFSFGPRDPQGERREGQFALDGCRVIWTAPL